MADVAYVGLWWEPVVLALPLIVLLGFLLWAMVLQILHQLRWSDYEWESRLDLEP